MHRIAIPKDVIDRVTERQGRLHTFETLDGARTALLVVDMQNYFMAEGEQACCPNAREIVPNVNRLAAALRQAGGLVIWIQNAAPGETLQSWANLHEMYLPEKRDRRRAGFAADSFGYRLWSGLDILPDDAKVVKTRYSAFIQGSSDIEKLLRDRGIATVLVAGVATNVCCESTARDAMMRGFRVLMVADANATMTDAEHNATLATFMMFFGDVQTTDEVVRKLEPAARRSSAAE